MKLEHLTIALKMLPVFLLWVGCGYADGALTGISSRLVQAPITQGIFQQTKDLKFLRKPFISTGVFTYHQNKGVIWKTQTPIQSVLLLNDKKMQADREAQPVPPAFARVFKAILGGDLRQLTESFEVTVKEEGKSWLVTLVPKEEMLKKIIEAIVLVGDREVERLEIQETSGNLTRINFSEMTHPARLSVEQEAEFGRLSP